MWTVEALSGDLATGRTTSRAPVGLMVCGVAMSDRHVLAAARAVEGALARGN